MKTATSWPCFACTSGNQLCSKGLLFELAQKVQEAAPQHPDSDRVVCGCHSDHHILLHGLVGREQRGNRRKSRKRVRRFFIEILRCFFFFRLLLTRLFRAKVTLIEKLTTFHAFAWKQLLKNFFIAIKWVHKLHYTGRHKRSWWQNT